MDAAEAQEKLPETSGKETGVREVRGWREGPYNRIIEPLPYDTLLKKEPQQDLAATTEHQQPPSSSLTRSLAYTRAQITRAWEIYVKSDADEKRTQAPLVNDDQLVPLPFRPPTVWSYVGDVVLGTWELVLYVLVMLLAIMLETNARYFRAGAHYDKWWVYLYKVIVIGYPAGIMVLQFTLLCEYVFRKYLFFRLLSLGVLVKPESRPITRSWYFVLFAAVWIILNVWAWWGLIAWWGRNGKNGPEYLSFAVFAVVNVVSFHLLAYYKKLMEEQKRLLKPVQAYLLTDMVLVSEGVVKQEGWRVLKTNCFCCCYPGPTRFDVEWVRQQGVHVPRSYTGSAEAVEATASAQGEKALLGEPSAEPLSLSNSDGGDGSDTAADPAVVAAAAAFQAPVPEAEMERGAGEGAATTVKSSEGAAMEQAQVVRGTASLSDSTEPPGQEVEAGGAGAGAAMGAAAAGGAVAAVAATASATPKARSSEDTSVPGAVAPATGSKPAVAGAVAPAAAPLPLTVDVAGVAEAADDEDSGFQTPMDTSAPLNQASFRSAVSEAPFPGRTSGPPSSIPAGTKAAGPGPVAEATQQDGAGTGESKATDAPVLQQAEVVSAKAKISEPPVAGAEEAAVAPKPDPKLSMSLKAGQATWGACRKCGVCCFRCWCCCCICAARVFDPRNFKSGLFALPTAFISSFAWRNPAWPFRRDLSYLRVILAFVFLSFLLILGGIAFGAWLVARQPPICQWGKDACYDCLIYQEEYVQYDQVCPVDDYTITKEWPDPDYYDPNCESGRSWFTNGVWANNGTLAAPPPRVDYQNITGTGLLNGYLANIMAYYAYADSFEGLEKGFEGQYIKRFKALFNEYGITQYDFIFIDDTAIQDTQFIVAGTGVDLYMIFRGTDSLADSLFTDMAGRCIDNDDFGAPTCVHRGFLSAYRLSQSRVYSGLIKVIQQLNIVRRQRTAWRPRMGGDQPFTLWLTGHSLGGALATLCAMDLRNKGLRIDGIYTYGSPRVGDSRFRDLYNSYGLGDVTWRFVHGSDSITQVPFFSWGYRHVTPPYQLSGGRCVVWPSEEECVETTFLGTCATSTSDHSLTGYLGNLHACIDYAQMLPNCTEAMLPLWQQMADYR